MEIKYNELMKQEIGGLHKKVRLLLHCCCAPCAAGIVQELANTFDVYLYFYNPNLDGGQEYDLRRSELCTFAESLGLGEKLIIENYDHTEFLAAAKGLENEPERGMRCAACIGLRLAKTAQRAKSEGFEYFCSTLSISPLKDAKLINELGILLQSEKTKWLQSDFKKEERGKKASEVCKKLNVYRQNYCGCEYSKK